MRLPDLSFHPCQPFSSPSFTPRPPTPRAPARRGVQVLGNVNHRDRSLPIVLRNPEGGLPALAELMAAGEVCILRGCADWRECHRELVGRLMQERLPGLEPGHLDAEEIGRRWRE
jgi:hypothetical protein